MADKLLFILTSVKQNPIQEIHGQLFEMSPSTANQWSHLLHRGLTQALADHDRLPARTADEVATLLAKPKTEATSPAPLFGMMGLSGRSRVRQIPRSTKNSTVARSSGTRSKTSSSSMSAVTFAA